MSKRSPNVPKETHGTPETKTEHRGDTVAYRYVGDGNYLAGIPARDLTYDDVETLRGTFTEPAELDDAGNAIRTRDATKKALEASGLYEGRD